MITFFELKSRNNKLRELNKFRKGCWMNVVNPTSSELKYLIEKRAIDEDLLEEGLDEHELPRFDVHEDKTYFFVKEIFSDNELGTVLIILSDDFLVTVCKREPVFVKKAVEGQFDLQPTHKLHATITFLSHLNDNFEKPIMNVVRSVQKRRKDPTILKEQELQTLLHQEEFLSNLTSMYVYTNLLYTKMIKKLKFSKEDKEMVEDLIVDTEQNLNLCKTSLRTITNIRDYYSIAQSNQLNRNIKALTVLTVIITIPAAVSGIYGMNVTLPWQENNNAFWLIISLIAMLWGIFFYFIRKKQIL